MNESFLNDYPITHSISKDEVESLFLSAKNMNFLKLESLIYTKSCFKNLKVYPKSKRFFLYDPTVGQYREFGADEIKVLLMRLLQLIAPRLGTMKVLNTMYKHLLYGEKSILGVPKFDSNVRIWFDEVRDLKTGELKKWSPDFFIRYSNYQRENLP